MKHRLTTFRRLAILLVLTISLVAISVPSSYCADCEKGGAVDRAGKAGADIVYENCCGIWGCDDATYATCWNESEQAYNAYVLLKGCANLMH